MIALRQPASRSTECRGWAPTDGGLDVGRGVFSMGLVNGNSDLPEIGPRTSGDSASPRATKNKKPRGKKMLWYWRVVKGFRLCVEKDPSWINV